MTSEPPIPGWSFAARQRVELAAGPVRYRERGAGADTLLLHGLRTNGHLWRRVAPALDHARAIVPDLPLGAHHLPMGPDADLSPRGLARLVVDFLDAIGVARAIVVGADQGTLVAQVLAAEHPERVRGLVLTPGPAFGAGRSPLVRRTRLGLAPVGAWRASLEPFRPFTPRRLRRAYARLAQRPLPPDLVDDWLTPSWSDPGIRRDLRRAVRALEAVDPAALAERLARFPGPALVAWASEDTLYPYSLALRLHDLLPDGRLLAIPDSGALVPEDRPRVLAAAIDELAGELSPGAGDQPVAGAASA